MSEITRSFIEELEGPQTSGTPSPLSSGNSSPTAPTNGHHYASGVSSRVSSPRSRTSDWHPRNGVPLPQVDEVDLAALRTNGDSDGNGAPMSQVNEVNSPGPRTNGWHHGNGVSIPQVDGASSSTPRTNGEPYGNGVPMPQINGVISPRRTNGDDYRNGVPAPQVNSVPAPQDNGAPAPRGSGFISQNLPSTPYTHRHLVILNGWPGSGKKAIALALGNIWRTLDLVLFDHLEFLNQELAAFSPEKEDTQTYIRDLTESLLDHHVDSLLGRDGAL